MRAGVWKPEPCIIGSLGETNVAENGQVLDEKQVPSFVLIFLFQDTFSKA
jgi:hypothetical protein